MVPPAIVPVLTVIAAAGTVIQGVSAFQQGKAARRQAQQQAELQRQAAEQRARQSRRASKRQMGRLIALTAAQGLEFTGSPLSLAQESAREAELEYQQILAAGANQSLATGYEGDLAAAQGQSALFQSFGKSATILGSIDAPVDNPMQTTYSDGTTVYWNTPRQLPTPGA